MLSDSDLVAELLAREVESGISLAKALGVVLETTRGRVLDGGARGRARSTPCATPTDFDRCASVVSEAKRQPEGWIVASESPALDVVGATFVREIAPGEMVTITETGVTSVQLLEPARGKQKLCIFEFVYFARPDTYLMGHQVHTTRRRMGELLAAQSHVEADIVMGVPDSGVPAAEGFAKASGIPFGYGLVKNRYIGRTFISPDQNQRAATVRRKLNPLRENIEGQRLIVVDDSIVRGTTTREIVKMLRDAGAREVHLRISSPPFMNPCYYGIDTPDARRPARRPTTRFAEMNDFIGSDSLEFITLENLRSAIQLDGECCDACLTGAYPAPTPVVLGTAGSRW